MTARPAIRVAAFAGALQLAVAVALPALYQHLLRLSPAQANAVRLTLLAVVVAVLVGEVLLLTRGVARVHAEARVPEERPRARQRALMLSDAVAKVMLGCEALGLIGLGVSLTYTHAPPPVIAGVLLCSAAVLALLPVPVFGWARVALTPLAISVGDERPPEGRGWSIGTQLGYGIGAVACAALVPAAVFGAAELDRAAAGAARARAQVTGVRLALEAGDLDVSPATSLITRTPLAGGERTVYRAPSGTLLPEEAAIELADQPYIEVPLAGALRGGALRVYYVARPIARGALLVVTLTMLFLTLVIARLIGRAIARDLRGVALQIERVAHEQEPGRLHAVATAEVRRLTHSVNRLLERIPRFTVESFLAIERADEAQRLKSQFLANMSHDLRSPLNSILGFSELLLRGVEGEISERQRRQLGEVQDQGNQLLRLLNEILDTAKLESGKMELHRQSAPPAELVRAALQEARRGRRTAEEQVQIELRPGLQLIHADPLRVQQAVTHLLNWAFDTGAGRQVTLRAGLYDEAGQRRFIVELEHSVELSPDEAARLFDSFRQPTPQGQPAPQGQADSRPDDASAGLHLALPLARRLAELHGGSLELAARSPARLKMVVPVGGRIG